MTRIEWKILCRDAKNKGQYPQLIHAIETWVNKVCVKNLTNKKFICDYNKYAIEKWYLNYFMDHCLK